jgi:hypothetical protein
MGFQGAVHVPTESNGGVPVNQQDQTTPLLILPFHQTLGSVTLDGSTVLDSHTIDLVAGHSASIGESLYIREGARYYLGIILSISTNQMTMDSPMDRVFSSSATAQRVNTSLIADGSTTPVTTHVVPPLEGAYDLYNINLVFAGSRAMDPSMFGGLDALTRGCILRYSNSTTYNVVNIKSNLQLISFADDHGFQPKLAGGEYYFFSSHSIISSGVAFRLSGDDSDELKIIVQDDLTGDPNLAMFAAVATGHQVTS